MDRCTEEWTGIKHCASSQSRLGRHNNRQGDRLSWKPGNVGEFDSGQGNVRNFTKNQGKNLVREKLPKLFTVSWRTCRYLVGVYSVLNIKYMVSHHALFHSYPTTDSNTRMGVIGVTLNMSSAVEECREPSGNFTLSGEWSPLIED